MSQFPFAARGTALCWLVLVSLLGSSVSARPTFTVAEQEAVTPAERIPLFNGRDLAPFYTWLVGDHYTDPHRVFTVVPQIDGAPAIRISGERYGGIVTRQRFRRYRLILEFRWGLVTWPPRTARPRDSGVLVHAEGADGNTGADFNGAWMRSIEAQIIEGGVGDFILVAGHEADGTRLSPTMTVTVEPDRNGQPVFRTGRTCSVFVGCRMSKARRGSGHAWKWSWTTTASRTS